MFNGATNLGMSSNSATFYNNVHINGSLVLNNKLNPIYISTSTGTLSAAIMGYLVNITSDIKILSICVTSSEIITIITYIRSPCIRNII